MFVCCDCCVLSGRGLRDELITRPEESYRLWCVVVSDLETKEKKCRPHKKRATVDTAMLASAFAIRMLLHAEN